MKVKNKENRNDSDFLICYIISWLGRWFWNIYFDADVECDVAEIRRLLDEADEEPTC